MCLRDALDAYLSNASVRDAALGIICNKLKCPRLEAEDILHEAILEAYKSVHALRSVDAIPAWFAVIVRNVRCKAIHRRSIERSLSTELFAYILYPMGKHSPERDLIRKEREEFLHRALKSLLPSDRFILERFYLEGETLDEISRSTGLPYVIVKLRKHRAKCRLRAAFRKFSPDFKACAAPIPQRSTDSRSGPLGRK